MKLSAVIENLYMFNEAGDLPARIDAAAAAGLDRVEFHMWNQVDIDAGELAKAKGSTADVRAFAQQMITDHGGVNRKAKALAARLHVTPSPGETSAALQKGGDENVATLKKLSGPAFDRAYVDHEVAYHQQVIDALDKTLIPSAQNAELKDLLVSVRPAFVAHLDHAKHLQSALPK